MILHSTNNSVSYLWNVFLSVSTLWSRDQGESHSPELHEQGRNA